MTQNGLNWITGYIWGIADDVLRDLYVRGKYRDVILPMTVLRRLDAVLEKSKQAVLEMKVSLDKAGVVAQDPALRQVPNPSVQQPARTATGTCREESTMGSRNPLGHLGPSIPHHLSLVCHGRFFARGGRLRQGC